MRKKRSNLIGRKTIIAMLCVFVFTISIDPGFASYVYANSIQIQGVFNEELSKDKSSAIVKLAIDEADTQTIESVTLPDQRKIVKGDFNRNENNQILFEYTAVENKKIEYVVEFTEHQTAGVKEEVSTNASQAISTADIKRETLTYNVQDIVTPKEPMLLINAEDITYTIGEKVDFRKGIKIVNEVGDDISNQLNFDVIDYGNYSENIVGTYSLTYSVVYPDNEQTYEFTRSITMEALKSETALVHNATLKTDMNTGIELSSNNVALKTPGDFKIGQSNQSNFNVMVKYVAPTGETGRSLIVTIPEGFKISRAPTLDQISQASNIAVSGNELTVSFADGQNVDTVFEVALAQDWVKLYDEASLGDITKSFIVTSKSNQSSNTNSFDLFVKEFEENDYKFEMQTTYDATSKPLMDTYNKDTAIITFKYERQPYMKTDASNDRIIIPVNLLSDLDNLNLNNSTSRVVDVYEDGKRIGSSGSGIAQSGNSLEIANLYGGPNIGREFKHTVYEYRIYYGNFMASNQLYESNADIITNFNGVNKNLGKLVIDTRENIAIESQPKIWNQYIVLNTNGIVKDLVLPSLEASVPADYRLLDVTYTVDIPYELKVGKGINRNFKLHTNLGNVYNMTDENLDKLNSSSDEYVTQMTSTHTDINFLFYKNLLSSRFLSNLEFEVREAHKDGTAIKTGDVVTIKTSISSSDSNIIPKENEVEAVLTAPIADDLVLARRDTFNLPSKTVRYGDTTPLASVSMHFANVNENVVYKNAKLEIEGSEMLSLVDSISVNKRYINGALGSNASYYRYMYVEYSTNKRSNVRVAMSDNVYFSLASGEYVTNLVIGFTRLDPTNPIHTNVFSGNQVDLFMLKTSSVKESIPFNGEIAEGSYGYKVTFSADNGTEKTLESATPTIEAAKPKDKLQVADISSTKIDMTSFFEGTGEGGTMMSLKLRPTDTTEGRFNFKNVKIDLTTDKVILASLKGLYGRYQSWPYADWSITYETNLGNSTTTNNISANMNSYTKFNLIEGEYVTKAYLTIDTYASDGVEFIFIGSPHQLKNTDIGFIGIDYNSYPLTGTMTASNTDEVYIHEGKTAKISGNYPGNIHNVTNNGNPTDFKKKEIYQGEVFGVSTLGYGNVSVSSSLYGDTSTIVNPIVYLEIDNNFMYVENSIKQVEINGITPTITFDVDRTSDHTSILKIDYSGLTTSAAGFKTAINKLNLELMVNPSAVPIDKISPLKAIYYDLNDGVRSQVDYTPSVGLSNLMITDVTGIQDDINRKLFKFVIPQTNNANVKILEQNEMGIGNFAGVDDSIGYLMEGYDNSNFNQQLSIISNYDKDSKDWIMYIPVPKEGTSIEYAETKDGITSILKSDPSQFSMELAKKVNIPGLPSTATISYTMDSNPVYATDGTSVGNYDDTISDADLKKVTMIKIEIPTLTARTKLFTKIEFKVANRKQDIGTQSGFGSVYFNMKVEGNSGYIYEAPGGYAKPVQYDLIDFNTSGTIWEESDIPINHILSTKDRRLENVKVTGIDANGTIHETLTDENGNYSFVIPTHGKTDIKVVLPNNETAIPKQIYTLVEKGKGTDINSSKFDQGTAQTTLNFENQDIKNIHAGLLAERGVAVNPGDITVKVGETILVPAVTFPNNILVSYQNTANTSIATVSADGKVTGLEVGTTTATVTIPDGKGGNGEVIATYNIKVVPVDVPTAKFDSITIFQNGEFDATSGIEILGSDKKPIDVLDTAKVVINEDSVDVSVPGKYPITYTINDGYNVVTITRYIYVHGNIQLVVPNDLIKKVGDSVTALDGAFATYIHINEDGTQSVKSVPVTTPNATITSIVASRINVPLVATISINGATDTATGSYAITYNEKASILVENDNVTVKVGATLDDIKDAIKASASMMTPDGKTDLTDFINWDFLDSYNTNITEGTISGNIFVFDPDTGEKIEKEITITISKSIVINVAKTIDIVVGDIFDPLADVTITDGDGKNVTLTVDMIVSNKVEVDATGATTNRGVYEVEYEYTDTYGNTMRAKTIVNVHGELQFDDTRKDFLQNDSVINVNSPEINKELGYYIDATGNKKLATLKTITEVSNETIGKLIQNLIYTHPVNSKDTAFDRAIYVHGHLAIQVPNTYIVKVNTEINTLKDVTASYKFVEDDGTIVNKTTSVSSSLGSTTTSGVPTEKTIPVEARAEVVVGLSSNAINSYTVIFNGMPSITTSNDSIEVKVGATFEEIKNTLNAYASVQYGDEVNPTDLTAQINWDEISVIDTLIKDKVYTVKLYVTDKDGAIAEKRLEIKISSGIIMNLPSVDKVIGDSFDPKENVTIFDGQGKPVDLNDVIIDDSNVNMDKPGSYDVTYTYTDSLGNTETKTNTIKVHGKLQFEGLDRIDLIQKVGTYVVDTAKAYYINNEGEKVYVDGIYNNAALDQNIIGKNEFVYSAVHPINNVKENSTNQDVFIHGDIVFHKSEDTLSGKVNTTLNPNSGVSATFDFVNNDGSITTKDVPVTSKEVTSNTVGYVDGKISAEVEVVEGLTNSKEDTVKVGFNGLPYINAANTIVYEGIIPSKTDIINKMAASAGMKQADGFVFNLTDLIDYSDVNQVVLDKNGSYQITLTVSDPDGFTTYTVVNVIVNIAIINPEEPSTPVPPIHPTNPVPPLNPTNPVIPSNPVSPVVPNIPTNTETPSSPDTPTPAPVEKETVATVSRDIPLSEAKSGISNDFIKSYITASTEKNEIINFEIISHNVLPQVGEFEATIRLEDGTVMTVQLRVVDESTKDVEQPEYGHDSDCIIHWIMLLLFAGYSIYSIVAMLMRRKENKDLENALNRTKKSVPSAEGDK